jgi:hypothetical protein
VEDPAFDFGSRSGRTCRNKIIAGRKPTSSGAPIACAQRSQSARGWRLYVAVGSLQHAARNAGRMIVAGLHQFIPRNGGATGVRVRK